MSEDLLQRLRRADPCPKPPRYDDAALTSRIAAITGDAREDSTTVSLDGAPADDRPRGGRRMWAPAIAAAAVAALVLAGVGTGLLRSQQPAATPGPVSALVGILWQSHSAGGAQRDLGYPLKIEPNGRFEQYLALCGSVLRGQLVIDGPRLTVTQAQVGDNGASCLMSPKINRRTRAVTELFTTLFTDTLTWTVHGDQLTLRNSNGLSVTYTRSAISPARTRRWSFHGLGISLPATWPADATQCGVPIKKTVIFPGAVERCELHGQPVLTSVRFGPYHPSFDPFRQPPAIVEGHLIDGTTADQYETGPGVRPAVAEVRIHRLDVSVIITSPSRTTVDHLTEQLYLTNP
jgi:hypothetical protein